MDTRNVKKFLSNHSSRNQDHGPKPNSCELEKEYHSRPKGIFLNYDIKKCSTTSTTNKYKSVIEMTANVQDHENNDLQTVDDSNSIPNKMYKIVYVDGKIMFAKHYGGNKNDEEYEGNTGRDTGYNVNKSNNSNKDEVVKDGNNCVSNCSVSCNENKVTSAAIILNNEGINLHNQCASPKIRNQDLYKPMSPKKYTQETDMNENDMQSLTSTNVGQASSRMYASKKDLADARRGKAMLLIPLQKYASLNNKLKSLQYKEKRKRKAENTRTKYGKKHTLAIKTDKDKKNLEEFRLLKNRLSKIFTEAQINLIKYPMQQDTAWPDTEMEKVIFLKGIISQTAYKFLKYKMHFPLPSLSTVKEWITKKNISQMNSAENIAAEPAEGTVNVSSPRNHNTDDETALQNSDYYEYHMLDDSVVEEVTVQSEVKARKRRGRTNMKLKCHLCMRPFEDEEQVREHVTDHYKTLLCTSYLDAVKPFECQFCDQVVKYKSQLVQHHRLHLGISSLKCWHPGCEYIAKSKDSLKHHAVKHAPRSLPCAQCARLFKSAKDVRLHVARRHAPRARRRCALCAAELVSAYRYRLHMRAHERPPRIKCRFGGCGASFYSRATLSAHQRAAHRADRPPLHCPLCPHAAFAQETQLNDHLKKHRTRQLSRCALCRAEFRDYGEYYTHCVEQKHFRFSCPCACGEGFHTKHTLEEHKLQCTFVPDETNESNKRMKLKRRRKNDATDKDEEPSDYQPKRRKIVKTVKPSNTTPKQKIAETYMKKQKKYSQKTTTVQDNPKQEMIVVSKNYKREVVTVAENHQQKDTTLSDNDQQKITKMQVNPCQKSTAVPENPQQTVIKVLSNQLPKIIAASENQQQKISAVSPNQQQKVIILPRNQQQNIIAVHRILQQKLITIPSNKQPKTIVVRGDQMHNVIRVQKILQKRIIPVQGNQQNVENQQQKVVTVLGNQQQKLFTVQENQKQDVVTVLGNQKQDVTVKGNQQQKLVTVQVNQKQEVVTIQGNQQQKLVTVLGNQKQVVTVKGNRQQKLVTVQVNQKQGVVTIQGNQQQKLVTVQGNQKQELVTVQGNQQQKIVTVQGNKNQEVVTAQSN